MVSAFSKSQCFNLNFSMLHQEIRNASFILGVVGIKIPLTLAGCLQQISNIIDHKKVYTESLALGPGCDLDKENSLKR